jgi:predicted MPP superfamily phosphohydrolase
MRVDARALRTDGKPLLTDGKNVGSEPPKTLRILHISDLHLSRNESREKLDFLAEVTDDEYDFVFLTGDIFQHDESIKHAPFLLSRRPRIGAYAVLGNHDYYRYSMWNKIVGRIIPSMRHPDKQTRNINPLVRALESVGYDVLRNEARYLEDTGICLVGVDWPGIRKNRLLELVSRSPGDWLVIALFHLPRDLEFYNDAGVHYAFGGHTHGGQIRVPGYGPIITDSELARHEASGITYRGRTTFHISRGLGADPRTNFRLFCPPQASVIEITVPANCSLSTNAVFSMIGSKDKV